MPAGYPRGQRCSISLPAVRDLCAGSTSGKAARLSHGNSATVSGQPSVQRSASEYGRRRRPSPGTGWLHPPAPRSLRRRARRARSAGRSVRSPRSRWIPCQRLGRPRDRSVVRQRRYLRRADSHALADGVAVVYQGAVKRGNRIGYPDLLVVRSFSAVAALKLCPFHRGQCRRH